MMDVPHPNITPLSFIFTIAIAIGFFLSVVLFLSRKGNTRANKFLSILIFLFSIVQIWDFLMQTRLILQVPNMVMVVNPLILLLGPFVYFYVKSLTHIHWKFNARLAVHFIPAIAFYVYFTPVYLLTEQEKFRFISDAFQNHKFIIPKTFYIVAVVQIFSYLISSIKILFEHARYIKDTFSFTERVNLNWLKRFLVIFILLWLSFALRSLYPIRMIWEISACLSVLSMYIVGYFGYNQPVIFQQTPGTEGPILTKEEIKKYASSPLTEAETSAYVHRLRALMENEKLFLRSDLKIGTVADRAGIPVHHVSQIINEKLGKNFFDFVNEYRVNEVKKRFADSQYDALTILAIGFDSGFNSKTAFYSAFKRNTGVIPSEFKKHLSIH